MMEEGFIKGQRDNLPRIDIYTMMDFFSSNSSLTSTKMEGKKFRKAVNDSHMDEAVECLQVTREGSKCTVKCNITHDRKVNSEPFHCTLVYDETEEIVDSVVCCDCDENHGGCKHIVVFLIWLHKKSEELSTMLPALPQVRGDIKFIKTKDFKHKAQEDVSDIAEDPNFLNNFIMECTKRNIYNSQLMTYFMDINTETKVSLHSLFCKYKSKTEQLSVDDFITFCKSHITEKHCILIEEVTKNQNATSLWYEVQYGRIVDSLAYEVSTCKTPDKVLIEKILGGYQYKDPVAIERKRRIKDEVRAQVEKIKQINMQKCGLFLSKEHPTLGASPDGVTEDHVVEIKYPQENKNMTRYIDLDSLTPKYEAQVQFQMHFANKNKAFICIAHEDFETSQQVDIYECSYNANYCRNLINECTIFWKNVFNSMLPK